MDPQRLYREIIDLDKQLRELVRTNPLDTEQANILRNHLMEQTQSLAQHHPLFAATHELEQILWKPCFYKRIEEFRPRIRKYVNAVHANPQDRSIREHFQRVSNAFQVFIQQSVVFYEELRGFYWKWLENHRVHRIVAANTALPTRPTEAAVQQETCRTSLHRCLVFLGDLMRYRELHGQKAKKNFTAAAQYYHQALAVLPSNGNPHNQLAVLAMYVESEAVAVYRYCRSLLVKQPFITAEENLALLFERSRQRPMIAPETTLKEDKNVWLKSVLHRFTRLHGVLFSQAMACRRQDTTTSTTAVYSIEMESLLSQEVSRLIQQNVVGDALVLKLVITNVFCILQAQSTHAIQGKEPQLAVVEEDAIRLSTRVITTVIESILHGLSSSTGNGGLLKMMGPLSIYLDILRCDSYLLEHMGTMASREEYVDEFLQRLVQLVNHPRVQQVGGNVEAIDRRLQLKEYVELRGFAPLAAILEANKRSFPWREDVLAVTNGNSNTNSISEEKAWSLRASNVLAFATYLSQEYTGNPLLYCEQGQFATTPSVVSRMTAVALEAEVGDEEVEGEGDDHTNDVDFDDEVIVYQPVVSTKEPKSPTLSAAPMLPLGRSSSGSSSSASVNHSIPTMSPFTSGNGLFGGGGAVYGGPSTSDMGGGFGSFHGAFSNSGGLLTTGWGQQPVSSLSSSTSTPLLPQRHHSTGTTRLFDEMEELTAVERESTMYQQKTSSLSGLFGGIGTSFGKAGATPLYQSSPPPKPQRVVSSGNARPSPPPGFSGRQQPPPGFGGSPSQPQQLQLQPFFTRNPFVNP